MASLIAKFESAWGLEKDDRTDKWLLVQNAWIVDLLLVMYLILFVTWRYLNETYGPIYELFSPNGGIKLSFAIVVDLNNWILTPANWVLALVMSYHMIQLEYSIFCTPAKSLARPETYSFINIGRSDSDKINEQIRSHEDWIIKSMWIAMIIKILELSDTLILAMEDRMSYSWKGWMLHLCHHGGLVILFWSSLKYFPAGTPAVLATINAYAHAVSYTGLLIRNNFNIDPATWHDIRNVTTFLSKIHLGLITCICISAWIVGCGLPVSMLCTLGISTLVLIYTKLYG